MMTRFKSEIGLLHGVVVWHPIIETIMNIDIPSNITENTSEFIEVNG